MTNMRKQKRRMVRVMNRSWLITVRRGDGKVIASALRWGLAAFEGITIPAGTLGPMDSIAVVWEKT